MVDLYGALGLKPDATPEEIAAAGKSAQKKHHPDKGGDAEKFNQATRALAILRDPAKRDHYDRTGDEGSPVDPEAQTDAMAMSLVAQKMTAIVSSNADPAHIDVVKEIRSGLAQDKESMTHAAAQCRQLIKRMEAFSRRIKKKGDGKNILSPLLEAQVRDQNQRIAMCEQNLVVLEKAQGLIADYAYEVDAAQSPYHRGSDGDLNGALSKLFGI